MSFAAEDITTHLVQFLYLGQTLLWARKFFDIFFFFFFKLLSAILAIN